MELKDLCAGEWRTFGPPDARDYIRLIERVGVVMPYWGWGSVESFRVLHTTGHVTTYPCSTIRDATMPVSTQVAKQLEQELFLHML